MLSVAEHFDDLLGDDFRHRVIAINQAKQLQRGFVSGCQALNIGGFKHPADQKPIDRHATSPSRPGVRLHSGTEPEQA